ncbi:MAG: hypothetical protein IT521_05015 [Burkholderiales bacterium]|nr:hypothetical protein [Burkholderiales bacterium]
MKALRLTMALFAAAGLCVAGSASAQAMSKHDRDMAIKSAEAQYRTDKAACDRLNGNAKDICQEEAKGREKVAKADAEAAHDNTPKAREKARDARADADYEVAKEKCDDLSGNAKDVCVKEAKARRVQAKADAKADRVAADQKRESSSAIAEAKRDAAEDKRDASYKVAVEKCDSLSGAAKDTCVRNAKAKFGKT